MMMRCRTFQLETLRPVDFSAGNRFQVENPENLDSKCAKIADFGPREIEIHEVLPVEILSSDPD